ncbi:MAG: hypothetical protein CMH57_07740 [Myxococcales bacterium]|nr:hypothetical protein [Myxococcales bacterium]
MAEEDPNPPRQALLVVAALCTIALGLALSHLIAAPLLEDEGWYLAVSRLAVGGALPYVDMAYTQGPTLPWIYGLPQWIAPGLLTGRLTSLLFAAATVGLSLYAAWRLAGVRGLVVCASCLGLNPYAWSFLVLTKTYALASAFLALALALMAHPERGDARLRWWVGAGVALALGVGTRLSLAPAAVMAVACLALARRWREGAAVTGGGLVTGALLFGPFLALDASATVENLVGYHARIGASLPEAIVRANRLHGLKVFVMSWAPSLVLIAAGVVAAGRSRWAEVVALVQERPARLVAVVGPASVAAAQLTPSHPQPEYQVVVTGGLAVAAGVASLGAADVAWRQVAVAAVAVSALGLMVNDGPRWSVEGGALPLEKAAELAEVVQRAVPPGEPVLTLRTFAAVEANRPVPGGMEMGVFGCFPEQSEEEARRFHRINDAILLDMARSGRYHAVVFGEVEWTLNAYMIPLPPQVAQARRGAFLQALQRHYEPTTQVRGVGQWGETVQVYTRKP